MVDPRRGALRLLRGGLVNAGIVGLAAGAHLLGGGTLPEPLVLAALAVLTQLACTGVARWSSLPVLLAAMTGGQLLLHHAFAAAAAAQGCAPAATSLHHHGAVVAPAGCPAVAHAHGEPGAMLVAHLVATVLSAALLRHGDRALVALLRHVTPRLAPLPVTTVLPARPHRLTPAVSAPHLGRWSVDLDTASRRGPPEWLLAA